MRFSLALTTAAAVFATGALLIPTPEMQAASAPALPTDSARGSGLDLDSLRELFEVAPGRLEKEEVLHRAALLGTTPALLWLADIGSNQPQFEAGAALALSTVNVPSASATLAQLAGASAQPASIRASALRALSSVGSSQQFPLVVGLLFDSREPIEVREEACVTLAKLGGVKAVKQLVLVYENEPSPSDTGERLQRAVIRALSDIRADEARFARERLERHDLSALDRVPSVTLANVAR